MVKEKEKINKTKKLTVVPLPGHGYENPHLIGGFTEKSRIYDPGTTVFIGSEGSRNPDHLPRITV
jgi:hypothetical protein